MPPTSAWWPREATQNKNLSPVEHRRADGDVRQMRAAVVGGVDGIDVARPDFSLVFADDALDGAIHRAEMHRHVRRVGDQRAVAVKHRAGEIEPLLDVDRIGGVLQRHAHLLGDRHEEIVEHFEHDWIGMGADGAHALKFRDPPQHQVIFRRQLGLPALFDNDRLVRLDDDGRSSHLLSRDERLARVDGGAVPFSAGEEPRAARRRRTLCPRQLSRLFLEDGAAAHGLDRHRLDDQRFLSVDESELRLMRALEAGFHFLQGDQLHLPLKGRVRVWRLRQSTACPFPRSGCARARAA